MKRFVALFLLALGLVLQVKAQSFLDELRAKRAGEGVVTVNQSKDIDELVNTAKLVISTPTTSQPQQNASATVEKKATNTPSTTVGSIADNSAKDGYLASKSAETTTSDMASVNTEKKVMRNGTTITGYRVQVYSGGNTRDDRNNAERIGREIKAKFPELPIYVHFYSPRWICRAGNFKTYQEADNVLKDIKAMGYKDACIVKGKITVAN